MSIGSLMHECDHCKKTNEATASVLINATADQTGKTVFTKVVRLCPRCLHDLAEQIIRLS